jgi:hypothetical protein
MIARPVRVTLVSALCLAISLSASGCSSLEHPKTAFEVVQEGLNATKAETEGMLRRAAPDVPESQTAARWASIMEKAPVAKEKIKPVCVTAKLYLELTERQRSALLGQLADLAQQGSLYDGNVTLLAGTIQQYAEAPTIANNEAVDKAVAVVADTCAG